MAHFYAAIAFVLLWLFLGVFLYAVFRIAIKMDRGELEGPREHGL